MQEVIYIGADIGKTTIDLFYQNKSMVIANNILEIKSYFAKIIKLGGTYFVVCEATGGYE